MELIKNILSRAELHKRYDADLIIQQIKNYKVVSFDIYDTLIKRSIVDREELFCAIPERVNKKLQLKLKANEFIKARIDAEKKAINGQEEVTLEEVYENISPQFYNIKKELKEMEEYLELEVTFANSCMKQVYDWCLNNGKKIIIISDMYLQEDILVKILEKNGYIGYKKLYVSSNYGVKKESGNLYELVLKDIGCRSKDIIHIGDNFYSDYVMAKIKKINSYCIATNPRTYKYTAFEKMSCDTKKIYRMFEHLSLSQEKKNNDYWQFGYEVLGPLLLGICKWLHGDLKENDIKKVFFLSRDGGIIQEAYNRLYLSNAIDNQYLYASRRTLFVPQLWIDNDLKNFVAQFRYNTEWTLKKFCDWLDLDYNKNLIIWKSVGLEENLVLYNCELEKNEKFLKFYKIIKEEISKVSKSEYDIYTEYLRTVGFKGNIAIVDIGWKGRMQDNLLKIVNRMQNDTSIKGYYVGLYDVINKHMNLKAFLPNAQEIVSYTGEIFEYLFTSISDGSMKKIIKNHDILEPIFYPYEYDEKKEQKALKMIQEGALKFLDVIQKFCVPLEYSEEIFVENLKLFSKYPTQNAIKLFEDISYGENYNDKMVIYKSFLFYCFHLRDLKRDWSRSGWHIGFSKRFLKLPIPHYILCRLLTKKNNNN